MAEGIVAMERGLSLNLEYAGQTVRMVGTPERPEWVAADVGVVLGLKNVRKVLANFDPDAKGVTISYTLGGQQELATVTEPGLYTLIARSRKPEAKKFQRWVFHDVLPTIRKHGCYPAPEFTAGDGAIVKCDVAALTRAIGEAIGPHIGSLADGQREIVGKVANCESRLTSIEDRLNRIDNRRPPTDRTKQNHVYVVFARYRGSCPCCGEEQIVSDGGEKLTNCEFDHHDRRSENGPEHTWPVCCKCNERLKNTGFRIERRPMFEAFQRHRRDLEGAVCPMACGPLFPGQTTEGSIAAKRIGRRAS